MSKTNFCSVCGHEAHEPDGCKYETIVKGCMCMCCFVGCRCDGKAWYLQEGNFTPETGPMTAPDPEWLKIRDSIYDD